ncbi:hypothetical protein EBQ34_14985 [Vandammella animalimorsus]|uniref:Uncharacterized protein n=1 Tax=Vandammella animalimorsus TaxID=2029117 RepID=A0A3M6QVI4_9BURK|nr:hypothetical protein EBQ34_14985 [Vandammella animalimorsus]
MAHALHGLFEAFKADVAQPDVLGEDLRIQRGMEAATRHEQFAPFIDQLPQAQGDILSKAQDRPRGLRADVSSPAQAAFKPAVLA